MRSSTFFRSTGLLVALVALNSTQAAAYCDWNGCGWRAGYGAVSYAVPPVYAYGAPQVYAPQAYAPPAYAYPAPVYYSPPPAVHYPPPPAYYAPPIYYPPPQAYYAPPAYFAGPTVPSYLPPGNYSPPGYYAPPSFGTPYSQPYRGRATYAVANHSPPGRPKQASLFRGQLSHPVATKPVHRLDKAVPSYRAPGITFAAHKKAKGSDTYSSERAYMPAAYHGGPIR